MEQGSRTSLSLAILILVIAVAMTSKITIFPLITNYIDNREKILDAITLLQDYRTVVEEQPILLENMTDRLESDQTNEVYLEGSTTALANADLQDRSRRAIEAAGSEIKSTEVLPAIVIDDEEALYRLGVRVRFTTTTTKLPAILFDLESSIPYLFLDRLAITSEAHERSEEAFRLDIRLDIIGFFFAYGPTDSPLK